MATLEDVAVDVATIKATLTATHALVVDLKAARIEDEKRLRAVEQQVGIWRYVTGGTTGMGLVGVVWYALQALGLAKGP